jgi:crotonobetaine/carnitine-CoA ligase
MILAQERTQAEREHRLRLVKFGMNLEIDRMVEFEDRFGVELCGSYSQTELVGPVTFNPPEGLRKLDSVGIPMLGVQIKVTDENGDQLPIGGRGEIMVRSISRHGRCRGYLGDEHSRDTVFADDWWHTLDIGAFDKDGYLYITGRVKDMIKRAGFNIAAAEVERVLDAYPGIMESAVIGVADPMRDEADSIDPADIREFCSAQLAEYKVPEIIQFVSELPHTEVGKVDKGACRVRFGNGGESAQSFIDNEVIKKEAT